MEYMLDQITIRKTEQAFQMNNNIGHEQLSIGNSHC